MSPADFKELAKADIQKKNMKIQILGDGAFGSFLKELLAPHFEIKENPTCADAVVLAVPASAYNECGRTYGANYGKHLVNVCSVQKPTTDDLLKWTHRVTSIHPLFGRRTPADKRNSILTHRTIMPEDSWYDDYTEKEFLRLFSLVSSVYWFNPNDPKQTKFTPESHDILMAKTHAAALIAAKQLKVFTDRVKDVPDCLIPNSFRLMQQFVKTLDDMPAGTVESIMANPFV